MISKKIKVNGITKVQFVPVFEGLKIVDHLALIPDDSKTHEDPCIYGCTDSKAKNYDPAATCDNGTCEFLTNVGT